ncbi:MAG: ricin-type beta-trefoil lectin domain protein [Candidatus Saccharibacteria bacterium]|nr:MAG: ricin-type beta-trefoil lectin domain protein [Candidatus Saccharibacteria bacterium]
MIRLSGSKNGFALPTILIASVIMLTVLVSAVSATSSIRSALDSQYYTQLAREAAESGLARANGCLRNNAYVPEWSASNLYPNTTCSGGTPCTNAASCFVMQYPTSQPTVRATFTVEPPEDMEVSQLVRSTGKVELLRKSNGEVWRTFTYSASARIGVDLSLNTIAFSYAGGYGASFATIAADGKVRAVGYNGWGQLGNGTYSDSLTPTVYELNESERAVAAFTNFVSGGYNMFVLTHTGKIFGTGYNGYGMLGDGSTSYRTIPSQVVLPIGEEGKVVSPAGFVTYFVTESGNVYAAGLCDNGRLGTNYTISGCSNASTPARVALPTVTGDQNTVPSTNIASDYQGAVLRMAGGRVYSWGGNSHGQFANGTTTDSSTPVQFSTYGNSGQPKAIQIAFDGITTHVLDNTGVVKSAGANFNGQLGGVDITISNDGSGKCIDNPSGNGTGIQVYTCNDTAPQRFTFRTDLSIYNSNTNTCLDNNGGDGVTLQLYTCNGTAAQRFEFNNDKTIRNPQTGKCLNNPSAATLQLATCTTSSTMKFSLPDVRARTVQWNIPSSAGTITKVATDQWFTSVLTSNGEVWSSGNNNIGQLGNGTTDLYQPYPVKFILPSGVTATDVYVTAYGTATNTDYNNVFVTGSDGKVYGAGANSFGQLGDGTTTARSTPVAMQAINGSTVKAKDVVSGYGTTVVLTEDGKVYTVGNNGNGQLGDGTTTNSSTPKANRYTNVLPVTSF